MQRFQKLLGALTQEEVYEDRQLSELHQQRIQAELNRLKRDALEDYMKSLRDDPTDVRKTVFSIKSMTMIRAHSFTHRRISRRAEEFEFSFRGMSLLKNFLHRK